MMMTNTATPGLTENDSQDSIIYDANYNEKDYLGSDQHKVDGQKLSIMDDFGQLCRKVNSSPLKNSVQSSKGNTGLQDSDNKQSGADFLQQYYESLKCTAAETSFKAKKHQQDSRTAKKANKPTSNHMQSNLEQVNCNKVDVTIPNTTHIRAASSQCQSSKRPQTPLESRGMSNKAAKSSTQYQHQRQHQNFLSSLSLTTPFNLLPQSQLQPQTQKRSYNSVEEKNSSNSGNSDKACYNLNKNVSNHFAPQNNQISLKNDKRLLWKPTSIQTPNSNSNPNSGSNPISKKLPLSRHKPRKTELKSSESMKDYFGEENNFDRKSKAIDGRSCLHFIDSLGSGDNYESQLDLQKSLSKRASLSNKVNAANNAANHQIHFSTDHSTHNSENDFLQSNAFQSPQHQEDRSPRIVLYSKVIDLSEKSESIVEAFRKEQMKSDYELSNQSQSSIQQGLFAKAIGNQRAHKTTVTDCINKDQLLMSPNQVSQSGNSKLTLTDHNISKGNQQRPKKALNDGWQSSNNICNPNKVTTTNKQYHQQTRSYHQKQILQQHREQQSSTYEHKLHNKLPHKQHQHQGTLGGISPNSHGNPTSIAKRHLR